MTLKVIKLRYSLLANTFYFQTAEVCVHVDATMSSSTFSLFAVPGGER